MLNSFRQIRVWNKAIVYAESWPQRLLIPSTCAYMAGGIKFDNYLALS